MVSELSTSKVMVFPVTKMKHVSKERCGGSVAAGWVLTGLDEDLHNGRKEK